MEIMMAHQESGWGFKTSLPAPARGGLVYVGHTIKVIISMVQY